MEDAGLTLQIVLLIRACMKQTWGKCSVTWETPSMCFASLPVTSYLGSPGSLSTLWTLLWSGYNSMMSRRLPCVETLLLTVWNIFFCWYRKIYVRKDWWMALIFLWGMIIKTKVQSVLLFQDCMRIQPLISSPTFTSLVVPAAVYWILLYMLSGTDLLGHR